MIALVAAPRGGGDGPPVFFTVPWSPSIAERGGQMPGHVLKALKMLVATVQHYGLLRQFALLSTRDLFPYAYTVCGQRPIMAAAMVLTRPLVLELGMLPAVAP